MFTRGIPGIPRLQPCHSDLHLHPLTVALRARRDPRGERARKVPPQEVATVLVLHKEIAWRGGGGQAGSGGASKLVFDSN